MPSCRYRKNRGSVDWIGISFLGLLETYTLALAFENDSISLTIFSGNSEISLGCHLVDMSVQSEVIVMAGSWDSWELQLAIVMLQILGPWHWPVKMQIFLIME